MNGPAEATVAEPGGSTSSRSTSRAIETSRTLSMRAWRPRNRTRGLLERALPFPHRRHKQRRRARVVRLTRERSVELFERLARPEDLLEILHLGSEFVKQAGLVEMIVQHQSEAMKRPSITALTTMWADQNISKRPVSGVAAAAATSAGFIWDRQPLLAGGTAVHGGGNGIGPGSAPQIGRNLGFCRTPKKPDFPQPDLRL